MRNTLLPYDYQLTCLSFEYNVLGQKNELTKFQQKNNITRLDYAEKRKKLFVSMCKKLYGDDDFKEILNVLTGFKNKKLKGENN